jgi:hypothetical protein
LCGFPELWEEPIFGKNCHGDGRLSTHSPPISAFRTPYLLGYGQCKAGILLVMNASVTMRQAGQSKKMAEGRLSFEELNITILTVLFSFLKFVYMLTLAFV